MERKFLIILILFVIIFCGTSGNTCAQDEGAPDTLHIEVWPDDIYTGEYSPYFVRVPIYVSHDIVTAVDSISAFVIPLSYTCNVIYGNVYYCSLSGWWNNTTLNPLSSAMPRSIFRHLPEMYNPLVQNRMLNLAEEGMGGEWDYISIDLDGTSHFWLALMRVGNQDRGWWNGNRILLATMTFIMSSIDASYELCIDSCFWPPTSNMAFMNSYGELYNPQIWDDYLWEESYCFTVNPPPLPAPKDLEVNSDTSRVYLQWFNPYWYDIIYVYCQTTNVELIDIIPGSSTSYSYTPDEAGVFCYFLKGYEYGQVSLYSDPACVSFSPDNFLTVPSAITWDDSSLSQFDVIHCYDPGGYIPDSYSPTSYTPGYYDPPIPGECPSGFFWDPGTDLCWQECVTGFFWDQNNQLCRENCSAGYFWDDDDNLCRENCLTGFLWDADDNLCRPECASGYYWDESLNQCCETSKDMAATTAGTGWAYGNPSYGPGPLYLGWGTNLSNPWYDNNVCTRPLIGAIVSVPSIQPLGGTRIYVKHWFRTAGPNDRLFVVVTDLAEPESDIFLESTPDDLGFVGYYSGTGDNACGVDKPGFAYGEGRFVWSRFDIPTSFNGKKLSLKFILGSDGSGNQGPGGENTGWFLNEVLYIGMNLHRGDADCSGAINLTDPIYLLNYLFKGGVLPCMLGTYGSAGDANCDGIVNLTDAIYLLNYLFRNGTPPPCAP